MEEARAAKEELIAASAERYVSPGRIAQVCLALGEPEDAFDWWSRAVEARAVDLIWIEVLPQHRELLQEARFQEILERIGLAD